MQKEILEIVAKNLPSIQVEALRLELAKASEHEALTKDISERKTQYADLFTRMRDFEEKLKAYVSREQELIKRESEVKTLRSELDLVKMTHERDNALSRLQDVKDLAMAAFRNPTISKNFSIPVKMKDPYNNNQERVEDFEGRETTTIE